MSDFAGSRECTTHHYACDCREQRAAECRAIVNEFAEFEPRDETGEYSKCIYCGHDDYVNGSLERKIIHADSCPWERALKFVAKGTVQR